MGTLQGSAHWIYNISSWTHRILALEHFNAPFWAIEFQYKKLLCIDWPNIIHFFMPLMSKTNNAINKYSEKYSKENNPKYWWHYMCCVVCEIFYEISNFWMRVLIELNSASQPNQAQSKWTSVKVMPATWPFKELY